VLVLAAAAYVTEEDPRRLRRFLVPVYSYILHGFHGHCPFLRSLCAVVLKSVASLFVRDDRLSLGECDGVSVLNDLVHADKGCCTVSLGDLDFVVSDIDY
jgi:hypothetical protein